MSQGTINETSKGNSRGVALWTVGHSTRPLDDFIALLQTHGIRRLVDGYGQLMRIDAKDADALGFAVARTEGPANSASNWYGIS